MRSSQPRGSSPSRNWLYWTLPELTEPQLWPLGGGTVPRNTAGMCLFWTDFEGSTNQPVNKHLLHTPTHILSRAHELPPGLCSQGEGSFLGKPHPSVGHQLKPDSECPLNMQKALCRIEKDALEETGGVLLTSELRVLLNQLVS